MSTFDGIILEYPLISIDSFVAKNYDSTVYFLSHCHTDHMRGLKDSSFFNHLNTRKFCKIFVSKVSKCLLINDGEFAHLTPYLEDLPIEDPTLISVPNEEGTEVMKICVTLLPAGHCPGSVMFYFEGSVGNVLYTGDFRLPIGASARLKALHINGRLKPLKSIYIDTTFCDPSSLYIPTREQCLHAIISIVEPWLEKGLDHIVYFFCPAKYAYEFVFVELYKRYGVKTHVSETKIKQFQDIHEIYPAVTSVPSEARIHACFITKDELFTIKAKNFISPCGYSTPDGLPIKIKEIKPSAMFFTHQKYKNISQYDRYGGFHRVCYSTHSSLMEIRDMVNYLKPQQVYPNVVKKNSVEEILKWLNVPEETINQYTERRKENNKHFDEKNSRMKKKNSALPVETFKKKLNLPEKGSGSLPFYDEVYEISLVKVANRTKDMLNADEKTPEKCFSVGDVPENSENISHNNGTSSPLKWEYQPQSSQESNNCSISCCSSNQSDDCKGTSQSDGSIVTTQPDDYNDPGQSDGSYGTCQSDEINENCQADMNVKGPSEVTNDFNETSMINSTLKSSWNKNQQVMVEDVSSNSVLFPQCIKDLVSPVKNLIKMGDDFKSRTSSSKTTTLEIVKVANKFSSKEFEDESNSNGIEIVKSLQEKNSLSLHKPLSKYPIASLLVKNEVLKPKHSQEKSDLSLSDLEDDEEGKLSDDFFDKRTSTDSSLDLTPTVNDANQFSFGDQTAEKHLKDHYDFSFVGELKESVKRICEWNKKDITSNDIVRDNKPKIDIINLSDDEDKGCGKLQPKNNLEQKTLCNSFGESSKFIFASSSSPPNSFSYENLVNLSQSSSSDLSEEDSPSLITSGSKKVNSRTRTDSYKRKKQKFTSYSSHLPKVQLLEDQSTPEDLIVSVPSCQNFVRLEELSQDKSTPEDLFNCSSASDTKLHTINTSGPIDVIVLDDSS